MLKELLKDKALSDYIISIEKSDINDDPVRRYFESTLCLETINHSIDKLNRSLLEDNFNSLYSFLPLKLKAVIPVTIYQNMFMETAEKHSETAREYAEAINLLHDKNSFEYLKPEITSKVDKISAEKKLKKRKDK